MKALPAVFLFVLLACPVAAEELEGSRCYFGPVNEEEIIYSERNEIDLEAGGIVGRRGDVYLYEWKFGEDRIEILPRGEGLASWLRSDVMEGYCGSRRVVLVPERQSRWNRRFEGWFAGHPFVR